MIWTVRGASGPIGTTTHSVRRRSHLLTILVGMVLDAWIGTITGIVEEGLLN